jgi:hypothetical protein
MNDVHGNYGRFSYHDEWVEFPPKWDGPIDFGLKPGETTQDAMDRLEKEKILNDFKDNLFPGQPPLKQRSIFTERLTLAMSRDDITESNFDIMAYVREKIRRQLGPEAQIIQLYWGEEDFSSNTLHLKVGVETPMEI